MKNSSSLVISLFVLSLVLTQPVFAGSPEQVQQMVDTLRAAADEVKDENPELAKKLTYFADKKASMKNDHSPEKMAEKKKDFETTKRAADHLKNKGDADGKALGGELHEVVMRWEDKMQKMEEQMKEKMPE
mgnify:CR=1 FL=1